MQPIEGSYVALITPFRNGRIDEGRLRRLVDFHIKNRTDGIVPCGTTGESPTLSHEEHKRVIRIVIKPARGRIPVMAGTGSNSTDEALELTADAKKSGADSALLVCPYYNRPMQRGMYLHFGRIASRVKILIFIYNIPSRTGVNLEPETLAMLSRDFSNIAGVKEASGSVDQARRIIKLCGRNFCLLSGDDALTLPMMAVGGRGVISVLANIMPGEVSRMVRMFLTGDAGAAMKIHRRLLPLMKALFIETNPIPLKTAMMLMKMDSGEMRLPLSPMSAQNLVKLKKTLRQFDLLK